MSDSSKPAHNDRDDNGLVLSPELLDEILAAFAAAPPRTDDDTFRLPDGTPVTKTEYFTWVAEFRASGGS